MKRRRTVARLWGSLLGCLFLFLTGVATASAQQTTGTIAVTAVDSSGGVLPGALLTLTDLATNDVRTATTREAGTHSFVNLNFGKYKLVVSLPGFETQGYEVLVQSARTTDVKATLKVGVMQDVVEVVGGITPLVESTTNAINTTIDVKQIEDLPLAGRNIAQLSQLTAGFNGTWNGLPSAAQGSTVDGIVGNTTRWRYQSNTQGSTTAITPRLENIAEMVISTDQMDMNQGFGSSTMQVTYVTRRGSNEYHGRLYEGYRADILNAKNWGSSVKAKYHQNEFGGTLGGPILTNKLFFFASGSALDVPGAATTTRTFLTDSAKQGIFRYGNGAQANLLNIFAAYNAANGTSFPASVSQINAMTAARLAEVDKYRQNAGGLSPSESQPTDPNLRQWEWQYERSNRTYYPTFRIDYNMSNRTRLNFSYNQTKYDSPHQNADHWPGDGRGAANRSNNVSTSLGLESTISSNLVNQFKGGWLYTAAWFGMDGSEGFYTNPTINYSYGGYSDYYEMPNSRMQPIFSVSDNVTWVKGAHTIGFGGNWYREVNKYSGSAGGLHHPGHGPGRRRSRAERPDQGGHAGGGGSRGTPADRRRVDRCAEPVRDARRTHLSVQGASRLPSRLRRLRDGKHAGPEWGRVFDAERAAEVLGTLRPGLLARETKPDRQPGPALGLRLTGQGPDREVSLDDTAGSLRSDGRGDALPARRAVAHRHVRSGVYRP